VSFSSGKFEEKDGDETKKKTQHHTAQAVVVFNLNVCLV